MSWRLDAKSLWWDESLSLYRAQQSVPRILGGHIDFDGIETIDQHPPLYFLALKAAVMVGGESDLALRLPSVFFGVLLAPLLYSLGRRLRSATTGLLAALLGASSPFYLWYAQEARMYTMVTALSLLATWALWVAMRERRWLWGAVFAVSAAAAITTHYLATLLLPFYVGLALALWAAGRTQPAPDDGRPGAAARWAVGVGGAALGVALVVVLWRLPGLVPQPGVYDVFVSLDEMLVDALNSFSLGLSVTLQDAWPLLIPFGLVVVAGLSSVWQMPHGNAGMGAQVGRESGAHRLVWARAYLLIGYWAIPLVVIWLISFRLPFYVNSRYLMASSPAFYLTLALGLEAAWVRRRVLGMLSLVLLLSCMAYSVGRYFCDPYYRSKEDYRGVAEYIEERECLGDVVLVTGPESLLAFAHYYRGDAPVLALPEGNTPWSETEQRLRQLRSAYRRIWHVQGRHAFTDPASLTASWLRRHVTAASSGVFPSSGFHMSVTCYLTERPDADSPPDATLGVFDRALRLSRVALRYRDEDGVARAHEIDSQSWPSLAADELLAGPMSTGQPLAIDLSWAVEQRLPQLKMSLRLVQDQVVWAQADQLPLDLLPTFVWPVGKGMSHTLVMPIPADVPPSDYWVQMWVYEAETGAALSFVDAHSGVETPYVMLARIALSAPRAEDRAKQGPLPAGLAWPLGATVFGRQLELLAWRLGNNYDLRPGDTATLHLFWRVRRPLDDGWALVVNWVDSSGKVWRTETRPLAGSASSPGLWPTGGRIHGVISLGVPADASVDTHAIHILVRNSEGRLLGLRRGLLLWAGRDLSVGKVTIAPLSP
jgi:hypothetical protein